MSEGTPRPVVDMAGVRETLRLSDVGTQQLVKVDGRLGVFTPVTTPQGDDPGSVRNLTEIVEMLRRQVVELQERNAALEQRLERQAASADDVATAISHSVDSLQTKLTTMTNPVGNFGLREFTLESRVHVDVTAAGSLGCRFIQPGERVDPAALSTVKVTLVPVPRPAGEPAPNLSPGPELRDISHELGLGPDAVDALHAQQIWTTRDLVTAGTRTSVTAALAGLLGADRHVLAERIAAAALLTLQEVDAHRAGVLRAAGVSTFAELAAADPAALVAAYAEHAAGRGDDGWRPTADLVAQWVATARAVEARRG